MKNLLSLIVLLFLTNSDLLAKQCFVSQQFWKTSGISLCTFGTGLNGAKLEIMHYLPDSINENHTCKQRAFVCDQGASTSIPSGLSNLPDFVQYNPDEKGYPYSCGSSSDAWTQNLVFKGAHDEGFYSCNSGSPAYLDNVDDVNPNNPDNPLTCKEGYSSNFISGMSVKTNVTTGKKTTKAYTDYSCLKTSDTNSPFGEGENIGAEIDFSSEYANHDFLQSPQTYTNSDGSSTMVLPNGTKQTVYNNGTLITEYPDGEIRVDNISDLEKTPSNTSGQYIKYKGVATNGDKYYEMNNGIKYLLEPNGTLTKVFNDLVFKENVNYNTWEPSQSYGFIGHLGTSAIGNGVGSVSGTGSTGNDKYLDGSNIGDTSNENKGTDENGTEEPIDEKEASKSCTDSNLTYQEKMLCEMNAGFKKLNQESNPSNSVNNLLSDYNYNLNRNDKAIKYNLDTVAQSSGVSILEQEKQNPKLQTLNDSVSTSGTSLGNIDNSLKKIGQNIGVFNNSSNGSGSGSGSNGSGSGSGSADLDKYLTGDGVSNVDGINNSNISTDSNINNLTSIFSDFKTNLFNSFNSINNQLDGLKNSISNPDNIFEKSTVYSCPISYDFNLISYGLGNKTITVDGCNYFSKLYSIGYFIVYLLASLSLIFFVFSLVGFIV